MQAVAAEFSGYAGQFCCFFGENGLKQFCFNSFILKLWIHALEVDTSTGLLGCSGALLSPGHCRQRQLGSSPQKSRNSRSDELIAG
jgi:hypothetical protein